jgi:hypothetical protein
LKVIRNRSQYLTALENSITFDSIVAGLHSHDSKWQVKVVDLAVLAAAGGTDNVLQRLVPADWSHYANKNGPDFFSSSFVGSSLILLLGIYLTFAILKKIFQFLKFVAVKRLDKTKRE